MDLFGAIARLLTSAVVALSTLTAPSIPAIASSPDSTPAAGRLLVRYRAGAVGVDVLETSVGASRLSEIAALSVRVLGVAAGSEESARQALAKDPRVEYVERDVTVRATDVVPNDYWWPNEWSEVKTHAPAAWSLTQGSANVVVAMLDTGVDPTQPDLQGKLVAGYNVLRSTTDTSDDNGHGTWTAGVAGAASNNGIGVASFCWGCALMPVKVLDSTGTGTTAQVASGITWATDHGAKVISMSLAGSSGTTTLQNAVQYAHSHGVVLAAAAGNSSSSAPMYPAAYPDVLSVAGTDPNDVLYSWSNFGSWVKLGAPGCDYTTGRSGWYGSFCGTSAATPVVAGIAGLAFSYAPASTNADVERALESSAAPIGSAVAYGRVDAYAALTAFGGPTASPSPSPTPTPTPYPTPTNAPSTTSASKFNGVLTNKVLSRSYAMTCGAGSASLTLTFTRALTLTLSVYGPDGTPLASQTGASPVSLSPTLPAGTALFVVSGESRASFSLSASCAAP
ncbi:MAG: hypothetical protein AUH85_17350 [Chloroflexi bacterium 13_1_40CM_4_68_4]|nr:MAG: hypothetical protein AUH85_17350 [Chloroflexi bacterium 13_1_40CM_4_68_4]